MAACSHTYIVAMLTFGVCMQYAAFGCVYLWFSDQCVDGIERWWHAFFFSVQTSATIGEPLSTAAVSLAAHLQVQVFRIVTCVL